MKLIHQITLAFIILFLVLAVAAGVGYHYLKWVHFYQHQSGNKWEQYQEMVFTEEMLEKISNSIDEWQIGGISIPELKSKVLGYQKEFEEWEKQNQEIEQNFSNETRQKLEWKRLQSLKERLRNLIQSIISTPQANTTISAVWLESLDQMDKDEDFLRKSYFESLRVALARAQKLGDRAQQNSIYFILIVSFLVTLISIYNVRILHLQTKQLMEQERQMASAALVQNLAHEIRNPLGVIKSAASVIAGRVKGEVGELAKDISTEVMRVDSLLTDLLRLRHRRDEPKVLTDLGALVARTTEFFSPRLQASNLKIQIHNTAPNVLCPCRPDAIKQVIINLILNAIEASNPHTVIEITTALDGEEYLLQVKDFGHGIANDQKNKIFDLFYTTKPYGFGIGLTVVKRIVEDHRGRIEIKNSSPKGTTFNIYLPMKA